MDKGKIAEFDSPTALKSIEGKKSRLLFCLTLFLLQEEYTASYSKLLGTQPRPDHLPHLCRHLEKSLILRQYKF